MEIAEIVADIDRGLAVLQDEIAQLHTAREALLKGTTPPAAPAAPRQPRRSAPRKGRIAPRKKAFEVVPAGKLIAALGDAGPLRTRELAQATGGDPAQLLELLKEQEAAGQIRRVGTRAATRWQLITDEERIAERAAELRAASRRGRARRT